MTRASRCVALACLALLAAAPPPARAEPAPPAPYRAGAVRWRAADNALAEWALTGLRRAADGSLVLDPQRAPIGRDPYRDTAYYGHDFYNGGLFLVGEATSPVVRTEFDFSQAIASWNAETPPGTWIEVLIHARVGYWWTRWYGLGVWAADATTVERHSLESQPDHNGRVAVDTLVLRDDLDLANAFQLRIRLFSSRPASVPVVRNAAVAYSTTPGRPAMLAPGDPALWNRALAVPACSQMVYSDGGAVWCSPVSTAMILAYWQGAAGPCEPGVRAAVDGVYDWLYDGHGNWPFNTAYAATQGLEAYVARFTSLAQVEHWIAAGVPVAVTYGWDRGELDGAPLASSPGHLAVITGFDATGDPLVHDPAADDDAAVRRTYARAQLETLWLKDSGGTVYLMYPPGWDVPPLETEP